MSMFTMSRLLLLCVIGENEGEYAAKIHKRLQEHRNDELGRVFLSNKAGATYAALHGLERDRLVSRRQTTVGNSKKYGYWVTKKGFRVKATLLNDIRERVRTSEHASPLLPPVVTA